MLDVVYLPHDLNGSIPGVVSVDVLHRHGDDVVIARPSVALNPIQSQKSVKPIIICNDAMAHGGALCLVYGKCEVKKLVN